MDFIYYGPKIKSFIPSQILLLARIFALLLEKDQDIAFLYLKMAIMRGFHLDINPDHFEFWVLPFGLAWLPISLNV